MSDGVFNNEEDAYLIGYEKIGLGKFSPHRVGEHPTDQDFSLKTPLKHRIKFKQD